MQRDLAKTELDRRDFVGDTSALQYEIDVYLHSIDRLSTRFMRYYLNENIGQGIACWLKEEAIKSLLNLGPEKTLNALGGFSVNHNGMNFCLRFMPKFLVD